jgi:small-conductance mechanosensitive channel
VIARHNPSRSIFSLYLSSSNSNNQQAEEENSDSSTNSVEDELNRLQNILNSIEALESRNEAQLESFVDKEDQWNSMDDAERELLESKQKTLDLLEKMTEELLQMWIGAKSMEG